MTASAERGPRPAARLSGRIALVMGAGSIAPGISNGRACAITYAGEGALVICVDHRLESAAETAAMIEGDGGQALALQADATVEADVAAVVAGVLDRYGRIDILHNNIGAAGPYGDPVTTSEEAWDRAMALNARTAFLATREVVEPMTRQGGGVITNISSSLALRNMPGRPNVAYTAAKAALEALTHATSLSLGARNIRVNAIRIGFSETPLVMEGLRARVSDPDQQQRALERTRKMTPLGRHGEPWDVAELAVWLASDAADYVSGTVIDVDGGLKNAAF